MRMEDTGIIQFRKKPRIEIPRTTWCTILSTLHTITEEIVRHFICSYLQTEYNIRMDSPEHEDVSTDRSHSRGFNLYRKIDNND